MKDILGRRAFLGVSALAAGALGAGLLGCSAVTDEQASALAELLDKEAIREKLSFYQRSMDRCDHELGYSVFWEDSKVFIPGYVNGDSGRAQVDMALAAHPNIYSTSHQITNTLICINGDKAGSESYAITPFIYEQEDGSTLLDLGSVRYSDRWEKRNGEWRIIQRTVSFDGGSMVGTTLSMAKNGSTRDSADPSYEALAYGM